MAFNPLSDAVNGFTQGLGFGSNVAASTGQAVGTAASTIGGLGAAGLGAYGAYAQSQQKQKALDQTNNIVDQQTGLLNAQSAQQAQQQQQAVAQMQAQAYAAQQAFSQQAFNATLFASQQTAPQPGVGTLAPYPTGDATKPNLGHQALSG